MKLTTLIENEYETIEQQTAEKAVRPNTKNDSIIYAFKSWLKLLHTKVYSRNPFFDYMHAEDKLKEFNPDYSYNISYTPEDISSFCFYLEDFCTKENMEYSGMFISALINLHYRKHTFKGDYFLHVDPLPTTLDYLGKFTNGAAIYIKGNTGRFVGYEIKSGKITVEGNTLGSLGYRMTGGIIHILGNAESEVGREMKDGKIIVEKNTGKFTGERMQGGAVHINGTIKRISENFEKGMIYNKGERIR